ncbi:MAG: hypothetical protein OXI75_14360 [Rhodospirillales bacterium]|nr:hypothetical protein [Rhodospirillales bacterium]
MNKHWAEAWLGRPWVAGEHDCADFVVDVLREQFDRALDLPAHAESGSGAPTGATVRGWDRQIAALKGDYAELTASPRDGDGVLMVAKGARRLRRYHLGLWAGIGGVAHVLHCQDGAGSILHPIRDLGLRALELEGIYRWR